MTFSILARRAGSAALALGAFIVLTSCFLPGLTLTQGSLLVQISDPPAGARTLVPAIDMTIATWVVSGTGPNGATFSVSATGTTVTVTSLPVGAWTVNADGRNAAGTFIAHGSSTITVAAGSTKTMSIAAAPIVGYGALTLSLSWPAAAVVTPVVSATLTPPSGAQVPLAFSAPAAGASTYSGSNLLNGYYTLVIQLLDNTTLVAGAVDVVRIVTGQTTAGTFTFSSVNQAKGSLSVSITPVLTDPIAVTLAGAPTLAGTGQPFTVTESVPASTGNTTCVWYVNGTATATGSSVTLNAASAPLAVGTYRLDAVVFTADGLRAGSASAPVSVVTTSTVNLAWNPNPETDIAFYKLYVGTASGVYTTTVSTGTATTGSLPGLLSGQTYYAALTATNTAGQESARSTEISFTAP